MKSIIIVLVLASVHLSSSTNYDNQTTSFPLFVIPETDICRSCCPAKEQRETALHEIKNLISSKLRVANQLWTRVAYLNMSDPMQSCPQNWSDSRSTNEVRVCGLPTDSTDNCNSTFYSTNGRSYTRVHGQVIGYQFGYPGGFNYHCKYYCTSIDENYY